MQGIDKQNQELIITKKVWPGEEYKVFSIRIRSETAEQLDRLAQDTNRSRNEIIGLCLAYALQNYKTE